MIFALNNGYVTLHMSKLRVLLTRAMRNMEFTQISHFSISAYVFSTSFQHTSVMGNSFASYFRVYDTSLGSRKVELITYARVSLLLQETIQFYV